MSPNDHTPGRQNGPRRPRPGPHRHNLHPMPELEEEEHDDNHALFESYDDFIRRNGGNLNYNGGLQRPPRRIQGMIAQPGLSTPSTFLQLARDETRRRLSNVWPPRGSLTAEQAAGLPVPAPIPPPPPQAYTSSPRYFVNEIHARSAFREPRPDAPIGEIGMRHDQPGIPFPGQATASGYPMNYGHQNNHEIPQNHGYQNNYGIPQNHGYQNISNGQPLSSASLVHPSWLPEPRGPYHPTAGSNVPYYWQAGSSAINFPRRHRLNVFGYEMVHRNGRAESSLQRLRDEHVARSIARPPAIENDLAARDAPRYRFVNVPAPQSVLDRDRMERLNPADPSEMTGSIYFRNMAMAPQLNETQAEVDSGTESVEALTSEDEPETAEDNAPNRNAQEDQSATDNQSSLNKKAEKNEPTNNGNLDKMEASGGKIKNSDGKYEEETGGDQRHQENQDDNREQINAEIPIKSNHEMETTKAEIKKDEKNTSKAEAVTEIVERVIQQIVENVVGDESLTEKQVEENRQTYAEDKELEDDKVVRNEVELVEGNQFGVGDSRLELLDVVGGTEADDETDLLGSEHQASTDELTTEGAIQNSGEKSTFFTQP